MPDNLITTEELFSLEEGNQTTTIAESSNLIATEELSALGKLTYPASESTDSGSGSILSELQSKDLFLNEKNPEWFMPQEGEMVKRLNKKLKKLGWEASDETGDFEDKFLLGDKFSIYKSGGNDEKTKLVIDLNEIFSESSQKFGISQLWEDRKSPAEINAMLGGIINDHIALHSTDDNTESETAASKLTTEVGNALIDIEADKEDIGSTGEHIDVRSEHQARLMRNAELKKILSPLDDKIKHLIAKENDIELSDEDKKLSISEFNKKYKEEINVGYDYERLLQQKGSWLYDDEMEDFMEYFKNKTGQGKGMFGGDNETDFGIFGATSWTPTGEYSSLSERQVEKYVREGIQMYVNHQNTVIQNLKTDHNKIIQDFQGTDNNTVIKNEGEKNLSIKTEEKETALATYGEDSEEYKEAENAELLHAMTLNYDNLHREMKGETKEGNKQKIAVEMANLEKKIKVAQKNLYGDTGFIYSDKDGNQITKKKYETDGGNVMSPEQIAFNKMAIAKGLATSDILPPEPSEESTLTIEEHNAQLQSLTTYDALSEERGRLIIAKNSADFMRKSKGQYVINDHIAWKKLDELMEDPKYKDRINLVSSGKESNADGRVYEIEMGVLEEFQSEIIDEDGARFFGKNVESGDYKTPSGFFARAGAETNRKTSELGLSDYIMPWVPLSGGQGQNDGFTNLIRDNRDAYISRQDKLNVINQMLMERTDPTKKAEGGTLAGVSDFFKHTGESWNQAWGEGERRDLHSDDNKDGNGNYAGADYSNRIRKDIQQEVLETAEITATDEQKEAFERGVFYSAWEGTVTFVPLIAEFAATEVALVAAEVLTVGGATVPVAAAQASMAARWSNKLLNIGRGGKYIPKLARPKTSATIFTPLEGVAKAIPGAERRAAAYQKYLTSSKVYKGASGVRLTEKELIRLEKVTGHTRGTAAFTKAVGTGGKKVVGKGKYRGGITYGRTALNTVTHNLYHGLREELKMGLTFKEHYHPGGGVAFYGVGKLLAKAPLKFSETSYFGSKPGSVLENYSNILNSGLGLGRSGVAGMISVPLSQTFEKFVVDVGGGETFDFIDDMYPELTMKNAAINFFTYQMLGIKGVFGPKGTGFKTVRQLERLETLSEIQMNRSFKEGYNVKKQKWEDKKLEEKYEKYSELARAVKSKTDVLRNTAKWMDPKYAEKEMRRTIDNIKKNIKEANPNKEIGEVRYVNTAENLIKNKGRVATVLDGAAAGLELNKKTGKYDLFLDVSRATPGKIPHEIQHFLDKTVLENDPLAASRLVDVVMEKMGDVILTSQNKYKIVGGKKVLDLDANGRLQTKDYTVKEWVEENYILDTHEGNIEALGYFSELLSQTKHFHKFTRGGKENSWKKLEESIKEWQTENHNKEFDFATLPKSTKQQIINFFAEMAQAGKKGKTSAKYIKLYKTLGESLIYDQPNGFQGTQGKTFGKSLDLHEQRVNLQEILDKDLNGNKFVESQKGLSENEKTKRREGYMEDVKKVKEEIAELDAKILESEKDFKFENDIQKTYEEARDKNEVAWKIAGEYDPRQGQSAGAGRINTELKKYEKLPNFEFEKGNILNDLLTDSNRSIRQMVLDYNPDMKNSKGEKIPLSGYIGSILKKRGLSESVQKFIPEGAKFSVEFEGKFMETEYTEDAVVEYDVVSESAEGIRLVEALKIKPQTIKEIESKIKDLDLNDISFAKLKDLVPELTKEMFGKGPKSKAEYIAENWKTIYDLLPEGAMLKSGKVEIEGLSTQINPAVLATLYKPTSRKVTKGAKASAKETGKTAGLKVQEKIQGLNKEQFLKRLGIKTTKLDGLIKDKGSVEIIYPKGTKEYRNTTETLFKGIITETGRMVTNQVVRESIKKGKLSERMQTEYSVEQFDRILKAGKSDLMKSMDLVEEAFDVKEIKKEIVVKSLYLSKDKAHKFVRDSAKLMVDIYEEGVGSVYDAKTLRLLPKYKGIPKYTSDFVLKELFSKGLILDKQTMGKGVSKILNKGVAPGERGPVLEQYHIDLAMSISKEYPGLKVLTKKVTEGGVPDLHLELHGKPFNVEIKMANAQHGSVTVKYNTLTGSYELTKKNSYIDKMMKEMMEEAAPAWDAFREKANELGKKRGWKFEKSADAIPPEVYAGLEAINPKTGNSYLSDIRIVRPIDIKAVAELYNNKEMPNFYINIQGKGLHWMGKNIHLLNIPELAGDAILTVRPAVTTVTSKARNGWKRLNYRAIPTVITKTVARSNASFGNTLEMKEFMEMPEVKAMEKANREIHEPVRKKLLKQLEKGSGMSHSKDMSSKEVIEKMKTLDEAAKKGRKRKKVARGMSTFDFDETVGVSKNYVIATKGSKTKRIASDKWPVVGEKMINEGWKMDFSDFNKVTKGKPGPLMEKMKNQIKKFGSENVFILTARAKESVPAIHEWLKTQGIKIPLKNITGLGNSTGEAKAMWMLEKFAEGYNDMYFVDDAISNVKAVRNVLNQLDIKSKVQQAIMKSLDLGKDVNDIMEHSLDIGSKKVFSKAEGKVRGKDIKRRRVFMRDSAADLELLIEPLYGKGKEGIKNKEWFKEEFVMPFERGMRDYNTARQSAKNDYMNLRKHNKDVVKEISQPVEGTAFTNDMAMRVYLWNKAGYKIPDLAKGTEAKLVEHIQNNPKLQAYAENFARITKQEKGLKEPGENWWGETMAGEVTNINRGVSRKQYLQEWIERKNEMFTEENLNKMESKLGTEWRENIEDMFDRMETGRTRSLKMDRGSAAMMNYLNGGIGTIMNFNTRSAVLQTISTTNFLNMRENNPIAAARAMGNVKQFAKDFKFIMNSDMLKQRRDGLAMNVTEAEIASAAASSQNPVQSIISKVLKAGYLPTKMADSFAISFGGATFYRNRIKMYEKQGMKTKEAEKQAFLDFQVIAERTQQSSRADLLSKQQTSLIGRFILPFANTPMQMNRAGMKDILDISKGRYKDNVELAEKVGRISYYMGAQVAIFAGLQSALFAMLLNDDDVSDEKIANTKAYALNTTVDSMLRGFGIQGAVMSAFKNATMEYFKQSSKGYSADYSEVAEDLLNISPPIGSKFGILDRAGDTKKWAKIKGDDEFKFELGNPSLEASLMTIQATTNAPVYSPYQNMVNLQHAMSDQYETWQRVLMGSGWTPYNVGVEIEKKKSKKKRPKTPAEIIEARREKFLKSRR